MLPDNNQNEQPEETTPNPIAPAPFEAAPSPIPPQAEAPQSPPLAVDNVNAYNPAPAPQQPAVTPMPQQPDSAPFQPQPLGAAMAAPVPAGKSKKGLIIGLVIGFVVLLLIITGGIIYAVMQGMNASNSRSNDTSQSGDTGTTPIPDSIDEPGSDVPATTMPGEKVVGTSVTDKELGFTVTANKVRYDLPFDSSLSSLKNSYKGIAVEVTVKNDSKYSTSFYKSPLKLVADAKTEYNNDSAFKDYIKSENLKAFPSDGISRGNTGTGWLFFYTKKEATDFSLRYERREHRIIGGGANIPAKNFDIKLP